MNQSNWRRIFSVAENFIGMCIRVFQKQNRLSKRTTQIFTYIDDTSTAKKFQPGPKSFDRPNRSI